MDKIFVPDKKYFVMDKSDFVPDKKYFVQADGQGISNIHDTYTSILRQSFFENFDLKKI